MNVALRRPAMTREDFFQWAQKQEERYEFDGNAPIPMVGGTLDHDTITFNIRNNLHAKLLGTACQAFGPNAGIATVGSTVRYPDVLVSCTKAPGSALLVPDPVAVFEVLSPSSDRMDRMIKVREYRLVPSIRRYVIVERESIGLTVLQRGDHASDWMLTTLLSGDTLVLHEIGIEALVDNFYLGLDMPSNTGSPAPQPAA